MAKIPAQIGKYKILTVLGSGGSSIVYLGLHPTLKRKVVLKKLNLRGKKSFYERFLQEAALMMDLNHDHIVKVYDHFKEGSRHYMVMEFVEGASLDQIIEQSGPLEIETIRYVLRCCCRALSYIHSRNIIHRDIKPSNIFISTGGDVKLGDFGIAKLDNPDSEENTDGNPILGTPSYMAPEQFNPHGRITARTDIYALGVSYFELLTGQKMFYGESLEELRTAVLKGRHMPLYSVLRQYGFSCWRVIRRATFRTPFLRYRRSQSFFRALRGFRVNDSLSVRDLSERAGGGRKPGTGRSGSLQKSFDFAEVMGQKKKWRPVTVLLIIAIVLMSALGSAAAWKSDALYKYILHRRYGAFTLRIETQEQGESFPFESLQIFSGSDTGGEIFYEEDLEKSKVFYKKSSYYRLQVRWGNRVEWVSFYLHPLSLQESVREIELHAPALISQPVDLRLSIKDAVSGDILNPRGALYIENSDGEWYSYGDGVMVFSGKNYNMKLAVPGYYEKVFTRSLKFYENELFLNEELLPLPGKLLVHHNLDRLVLKVNGHRTLYNTGSGSSVLKFGTLDMEGENWLLNPGVYQLQWSGKFGEQMQKLTVRSGEIVIYRITSDKQGNPVFGMNRKGMDSP